MDVFDHETAQKELMLPLWEALPDSVKQLACRTVKVSQHKQQGSNGLLPFPTAEDEKELGLEEGYFVRAFSQEEISTYVLSRTSWVVYHVGHWATRELRVPQLDTEGRRFSKVASRVVRERLAIHNSEGPFTEYEGVLRWTSGYGGGTTSFMVDLGFATETLLAAARAKVRGMRPYPVTATTWNAVHLREIEAWDRELCEALKTLRSDEFLQLTDLRRYMVDEAVLRRREEERKWPKVRESWVMNIQQQVELLLDLGASLRWSYHASKACQEVLYALGVFNEYRTEQWRKELLAAFPHAVVGKGWVDFWLSFEASPEGRASIASVRDKGHIPHVLTP